MREDKRRQKERVEAEQDSQGNGNLGHGEEGGRPPDLHGHGALINTEAEAVTGRPLCPFGHQVEALQATEHEVLMQHFVGHVAEAIRGGVAPQNAVDIP